MKGSATGLRSLVKPFNSFSSCSTSRRPRSSIRWQKLIQYLYVVGSYLELSELSSSFMCGDSLLWQQQRKQKGGQDTHEREENGDCDEGKANSIWYHSNTKNNTTIFILCRAIAAQRTLVRILKWKLNQESEREWEMRWNSFPNWLSMAEEDDFTQSISGLLENNNSRRNESDCVLRRKQQSNHFRVQSAHTRESE